MTTLTGKTPAATYRDLLQVSNANQGIDATARAVEDGEGTQSPLQLSSTAVNVQTGFHLGGVAVSASAAEINVLDGITASTADLNQIAGATVTAAGRALLDDADAAAQRTTLGLGTLATQDAADVTLGTATITGQAYSPLATLTDAATIAWNVSGAQAATVTLGGNRTLANPTNMQAGACYALRVKQDATGSRTLGYGSAYRWANGSAPVLSTAADAVDMLVFLYDGTHMLGAPLFTFS